MKFWTGGLLAAAAAELELAIERLGGGGDAASGLLSASGEEESLRYRCVGGGGVEVEGGIAFERSEGFLLGIGGGPGLRRTCGLIGGRAGD